MHPISGGDASTALQLLADASVEREHELNQYAAEPEQSDIDEDNGTSCPVIDQFYERRAASIVSMTNFSPIEFAGIWEHVREFSMDKYTTERRLRSSVTPKDLLFMTLAVLKHGEEWGFMARTFNMKGPTFQRLVVGFVVVLLDYF